MSSAQDRIILIASVIVESVWLYVLIAMVTLLLQGVVGISWIAAVAVMGCSFFVARATLMIRMPLPAQYGVQLVSGVIVIYLILGTYILPSSTPGVDLGWLIAIMSDEVPTNVRGMAVVGGLLSAVLWYRGGRIASVEFPTDHISIMFKVGLIVLSLGAVVDIFLSVSLNIFPLMFAFFGAGLVGLSIGHILPASGGSRTQQRWTRIIGGVVGGIVLIGLVFSILQKSAIDFIATPLRAVLDLLVTVVVYVVIQPIAYVVVYLVLWLFRLYIFLFGEPGERADEDMAAANFQFIQDLGDEATSSNPSIWGDVIEWTIIAILAAIALTLIAQGFRRILRWRRVEDDGERESVADDVDPGLDMARLLFNLLPERFRRRRGSTGLRLPDDEQDIVDVFRIYFGMLSLAEERGFRRPSNQTPNEYLASLARVFPAGVARLATDAFNRACYGRRPASREQIDEMREVLERVASSK